MRINTIALAIAPGVWGCDQQTLRPTGPTQIETTLTVILTVDSSVVVPGGRLSVSWEAPNRQPRNDWIGLFKVEDPNEAYESGWWSYTSGQPSGTLFLNEPSRPGQYQFRYLLDDDYIDVARAVVTVRLFEMTESG